MRKKGKKRKPERISYFPLKRARTNLESQTMRTDCEKVRKSHLIRLILQSLKELDYLETANSLEKESGISLHQEDIEKWQDNLMNGNWSEVMQNFTSVLRLSDPNKEEKIRYLLVKQQFLELLYHRKFEDALDCLRQELSTVAPPDELHKLACLLLCKTTSELQNRSHWNNETSRSELIREIQKHLPPSFIIPQNQLERILLNGMAYQAQNACLFSPQDDEEGVPLLVHELSPEEGAPRKLLAVLQDHSDEVWEVSFSPNGKYLASAGKDKSLLVYSCDDFSKPMHRFSHNESILNISWSRNSTMLLSCDADCVLQIWDILTGNCALRMDDCCMGNWLPDNLHFVAADKILKTISRYDLKGQSLSQWKPGFKFQDIRICENGVRMVILGMNNRFHVCYPFDPKLQFTLESPTYMTSLALSPDGRYMLLDLSNDKDEGEVHLWDLEEKKRIQKFPGRVQSKFIIKSTFGGNNFVICGSEDCRVFVFNRHNGKLITHLSGHIAAVISTSFNSQRNMIASCSDDKTVRIYTREL